MFDLHSHILPMMDDGAKDQATSQAMVEMAFRQGTRGMVATPHIVTFRDFELWPRIESECKRLTETVQIKGWSISVYPGAEVVVSADLFTVIKAPGPFCINGSQFMLLELPSCQIPDYTEELFFTLQARGIEIILAHPERHHELIHRPEILWNWLDRGILVQINGTSLGGVMGKRVMRFSETIVKCGAAFCIGSDAHGVGRRNPGLAEVAKKLATLVGSEKTREILVENPVKILAGKARPEYQYHALSPRQTTWEAAIRLVSSVF